MAPLKAPRSCPNSSLSISPAGSVAQLTLIKGLSARLLAEWMARAISSLPVPVSPRISVVASVGATRRTLSSTPSSPVLAPMISSKLCAALISSRRYRFCASSLACSCSINTRSVMSMNMVRVYWPPGSGFDHHWMYSGLPLSLRRSSSTTPLVSVPRPTDANASRSRSCADGVSGISERPYRVGTSSAVMPSVRKAARLARMKRVSRPSCT